MSTAYRNLSHFLLKKTEFEVSFQMLFLSTLVTLFAWYVFRKPNSKRKLLSKFEEDKLIHQFKPEELIPLTTPDQTIFNKRIVTSKAGKHITVDGQKCLNLATHNYLCLVEDPEVQAKTSNSVNKYGVGSCGPRGFYGTVDVHLELEEMLAKFMDVEEACVYSYAFATMASAVPAYCKRNDIVFVDEAVNFSIQKGLDASRSNVCYFKHNDISHLESLLEEQRCLDQKNPKKAARIRRFLIVEGIYLNTGVICNLPELVRLRREYKLRLLLDESVSFGTLGATGKGVVEYYNIPNIEVDLRIGSMEGSLASIGGFCCGSSFIVEHQRLSGLGYCFSASLPPMLAVAALTALSHIESNPELLETLVSVSNLLHDHLLQLVYLTVGGDPVSPVKHLYLKKQSNYNTERKIINNIVEYCLKNNLAVVAPEYLEKVEKFPVRPSIRITANVLLSLSDVKFVFKVLSEASNCYISV